METFHILLEEHKKLRRTMSAIEQGGEKHPENTESIDKSFQKFKELFSHHDDIEEEVLYKTFLDIPALRELTLKAQQAHHAAKTILTELRLLPYASEDWIPKFLVLQDSVLAHMLEEEEILFVEAEAAMNEDELENLKKALNDYEKKHK